jgi:hypothetical protein
MASLASIEPDKRGFWHVNFWEERPDEEGVPCDGFATTKIGAPLEDAITLAQSFKPHRIAVWQPCEFCSGTGEDAEGETCDECEDGLMCRDLKDLQALDGGQMADVTGPISTLPGTHYATPEGMTCDFHPDRPAVTRVQGETDSFGCEMHDCCEDCARKMRAEMRKPEIGKCDWCGADEVRLGPTRDYEEGLRGPVYRVCAKCIKRRDDQIDAELRRYGDSYYD